MGGPLQVCHKHEARLILVVEHGPRTCRWHRKATESRIVAGRGSYGDCPQHYHRVKCVEVVREIPSGYERRGRAESGQVCQVPARSLKCFLGVSGGQKASLYGTRLPWPRSQRGAVSAGCRLGIPSFWIGPGLMQRAGSRVRSH